MIWRRNPLNPLKKNLDSRFSCGSPRDPTVDPGRIDESERTEKKQGDTVSRVLRQSGKNPAVIDQILPRVYEELHSIAGLYMRKERREHTLSATDLVHEAYLRLSRSEPTSFRGRQHFFAAAAVAMRRVLVDHARRHQAQKRIPREQIVALDEAPDLAEVLDLDLLALDEALCDLSKLDQRLVQTVELRFFAGLSEQETAEVLEVSPATVRRSWAAAKIWLRRRMER